MDHIADPAPYPPASLADTFDWMADRYLAQTRRVSWGHYPQWMRHVAAVLCQQNPRTLVDIGSGPGALLRELIATLPDCRLSAVDPSLAMLKQVPARVERFPSTLEAWAPSHRERYDAAVMSFVLRDLTRPKEALLAAASVLHSGGQLVVLETHTPSGWRQWGFRPYFHGWLPWQGDRMLTRDWPGDPELAPYRRLSASHRQWHRGQQLPAWLNAAGFIHHTRHTRATDVVMLWSAVKA
ncbi:MAG: class I SAM-dependent methyltransferase [Thermaerobacter sp.]|nr:class I SAM-dependent methyltransferase [Thermaerobacter sp.]